MTDHLSNRRRMIAELREELVGPVPLGKEIDCAGNIEFSTSEESYGPWRQSNGQEILTGRDRPTKRYGAGIIYPSISPPGNAGKTEDLEVEKAATEISDKPTDDLLGEKAKKHLGELGKGIAMAGDSDDDALDLNLAGLRNPACMGISFLATLGEHHKLVIEAPSLTEDEYKWTVNGRYQKKFVKVAGADRLWWIRRPVTFAVEFSGKNLIDGKSNICITEPAKGINTEALNIDVTILSRPWNGKRLITISIVNRSNPKTGLDEYCLFQSYFTVKVLDPDGISSIEPYPAPDSVVSVPEDIETDSFNLLYRGFPVFAVGHGCAANWAINIPGTRPSHLSMECLPTAETPSTIADIDLKDKTGTPVELSMHTLAGLGGNDSAIFGILTTLADNYESWITSREKEAGTLNSGMQATANRHLRECRQCLDRLRAGTLFLRNDSKALTAFKSANHAILLQQISSKAPVREITWDNKNAAVKWGQPFSEPDTIKPNSRLGRWRPFQLAFIVSTIASCVDGNHPDRDLVELIWFPTGGGKTEAYLGVAAFTMLFKRLSTPEHRGVDVIMRYTLRLLTTQQFQRASSLICAMEHLRRKQPEKFGKVQFSSGLWLGATVTPNKRKYAIESFKKMEKGNREDDLLLLSKCPWCASAFTVLETSRSKHIVLGMTADNKTVKFSCPDQDCEFHDNLPVYIIDEDIFDYRPSLIVGTVDKFANLIWDSSPRALFGIQEDGKRISAPPSLIIQDELHLISGPLGSMVGHFEPVIEYLCTDRSDRKKPVLPKIISSTATIRKYREQIRGLYGRMNVSLFPPPGLDAGDSFFGQYARDNNGHLAPGRLYIGVHAPSLGSLQTVQTRIFTVVLQGPNRLEKDKRDPWWTHLIFYNSRRELGGGITLFQSDIPDYMRTYQARTGIPFKELRKIETPTELTSRLAKGEVAQALTDLEKPYPEEAIDVCLASNIIEVGVDVDRLAMMSIVGQPKTTSQYIQVSGRVGRRPNQPGLVITLYGSSKPRDRSHFEKFKSYHERLYAQVEPSSVTPFAIPVLERALHGAMVAFIRQSGRSQEVLCPRPFPDMLISEFMEIMTRRMSACGAVNTGDFERVFNERKSRWEKHLPEFWDPEWGKNAISPDETLIVPAGSLPLRRRNKYYPPWETQTSMRDVDAQCELKIISSNLIQGSENGD